MKIIKNKRSLVGLKGRLITLNNEYLYHLNNDLIYLNDEVNYFTVDSQYIRAFLKYRNIKTNLLTGEIIFNFFLKVGPRKIIVLGKKMNQEKYNIYKKIEKIDLPHGNSDLLVNYIVEKYKSRSYFNDKIICVMLGVKKQESVIDKIVSNYDCNNSLLVGMGGTWEQFLGIRKVPKLYQFFALSWLYRTLFFWDSTKVKKILNSLKAFKYYNKLSRTL